MAIDGNLGLAGLLIIFIGGAGDRDTQLVYSVAVDFAQDHPAALVAYVGWDGASAAGGHQLYEIVLEALEEEPARPVVFVGHSWGGATALSAAKRLRRFGVELPLVVTLDPVSSDHAGVPVSKPGNAWRWVNVRVDIDRLPEDHSNRVARAGGHWPRQPEADFEITLADGTTHRDVSIMFDEVRYAIGEAVATWRESPTPVADEDLARFKAWREEQTVGGLLPW